MTKINHPTRSSVSRFDRVRSLSRGWTGIVTHVDQNIAHEVVLVVTKTSEEVVHEPDAVLFADEVENLTAGPFRAMRDEEGQGNLF